MNDFGIYVAGFRMVGTVFFSYSVPKSRSIGGAVLPFFNEIAAGKLHVFLGEGGFWNGKDIQGGIVTLNMIIGRQGLLFIFG
jgi:hypothetical protein